MVGKESGNKFSEASEAGGSALGRKETWMCLDQVSGIRPEC